jgi:DNA-binding NarL/FixJ family response regulator
MTSRSREMVRVLAVDDQDIFLAVAREVVEATPGFDWLGGVSSGPAALDALEGPSPDLVLLDVRMPGMDGLETAGHLHRMSPDLAVVLVSVEDERVNVPLIEECGARALVRKQEFGSKTLRKLWELYGSPSP